VAMETSATVSGMIEIPYVPASQRRLQVIEEDSIVVVGQPRPKKRKRPKAAVLESEPTSKEGSVDRSSANKDKAQQILEPFDYSTVPNILDDAPGPETEPEMKRKKRKGGKSKGTCGALGHNLLADAPIHLLGGKIEYGDFPAPPKAHRELKAGNQSKTFK
jgi:exosome complex exonuclease RRP6